MECVCSRYVIVDFANMVCTLATFPSYTLEMQQGIISRGCLNSGKENLMGNLLQQFQSHGYSILFSVV